MSLPNFETVLPRLVATYEAGRLVPFIGSGMSRNTCTDWATFVQKLEKASGKCDLPSLDHTASREQLIRRANIAVRTLKGRETEAFATAVRKSLVSDDANVTIPSQTESLAHLWWPLVLSTNYDNCYAAAFHAQFPQRQLVVVGRGAEDCQRVLTSLSTAGRSVLWALQGYLKDLPNSSLPSEVSSDLEAQLVVGHEEYRRVTYRDLHFRRAFADVYRQRSLLFLGAGIQESYLQELFGEVQEYYGPSTRAHYAFLQPNRPDCLSNRAVWRKRQTAFSFV